MANSRPGVIIIGGGIGGLFAANALTAQGLRVSVYEQAEALGEVGAGVFLTPNSVRHLQRVGLGPAVERWGARVGSGSQYFRHDGTPIAPVQVTDSSGWNATFGMHRADLVNLLAEPLPADVVHTGYRCTGFEQVDGVARVSFANGAVAEGDLVIGADGIHSELRPSVFPPSRPVFSGSVAYRGLVPHECIPHWPTDRWLMWLGKGKHFLVFPVRAGELLNFVGFVPADEEMKESWSAPGDPDMLRQEFAGWDPNIGSLLQQVHATFRSSLYDREPLPTWTRGRLSLLGDAAHPMLPHLGQGANQAIEDGMALATILAYTSHKPAPAALLAYFFLISWMPTLLGGAKIPLAQAALATALLQLGGVIGSWTIARPTDRYGMVPIMILFLCGIPVVGSIGYIGLTSPAALMIIVFFAGFCTLGIQMGLNAISALLYPTALRSTGSGWAFGVGRVGSILGPVIGGLLIAKHVPVPQLYMIAATPFVFGAVACFFLMRLYAERRRQEEKARG